MAHQQQHPQLHEDYIDISEGVGSRLFDKPVNNMGVAYIYGKKKLIVCLSRYTNQNV